MPTMKHFRRYMFNPKDINLIRYAILLTLKDIAGSVRPHDEETIRNINAYQELIRRFE